MVEVMEALGRVGLEEEEEEGAGVDDANVGDGVGSDGEEGG